MNPIDRREFLGRLAAIFGAAMVPALPGVAGASMCPPDEFQGGLQDGDRLIVLWAVYAAESLCVVRPDGTIALKRVGPNTLRFHAPADRCGS
jgi:hypothetical protein